ncbi:S8 family peptidase [Halobacillus sp. A1]|uniref:S8 family peptidase n=1 Tax=Halobacillus sp. A1 TaxID=2880262 RepID=UPI0020A6927B|nr:S8 family peptidase [Halobacillus sp. A1]MCP3031911.1 S8 family peptidase [Halobacillus sp. A1]
MRFKGLATLSLAFTMVLLPDSGEASAEKKVDSLPKVEENTKAEQGDYVKGEVVVKFKEGKGKTGERAALDGVKASEITDDDAVDSDFKVLKVGNVEAVVKALNKNPNVEYAEPNYEFDAAWTPNDTYYNSVQYGPQTTNTPAAWDITRGSRNQQIAVIDSGVDYNHPDLNDKTVRGYDFVDNDNDPMDENGHGTHVAGTAAAETNNSQGIAGMAPDTEILAVRALDASGNGSLAAIADAIRYSADQGAEVINLSLGCDCDTQTLEDAVNYAWSQGSLIVAAAGNDGVSTTFEPASYSNVIAVGAVDENDDIASFSNYGTWVDVTAPGVDIASTVPDGGYAYMSGTSMASPHVAGLAGLLASQGKNNTEIRSAIENSADPISGTGSYFNDGRINSYEALNY